MSRSRLFPFALALCVACPPAIGWTDDAAPAAANASTAVPAATLELERLLLAGDFQQCQRQLRQRVAKNSGDDNARFALGVGQVLAGLERTIQSLHRYGLHPRYPVGMPILRLPVPHNPTPEPITNAQFRRIVERLSDDLAAAEATLGEITSDDVRLPLHIGLVRIDMDGNGKASGEEALWKVLARVGGSRLRVTQAMAEGFVVTLDKADVHWLRGYCHLTGAMCDMLLAYDTEMLHDHAAHLLFPQAKIPYDFLRDGDGNPFWNDIRDVIAMIHLLRLPVLEPARMPAAREHLLAVIEQSRLSWAAVAAETDDHQEWIPGPQQKNAAVPFFQITGPTVDQWHAVLDEAERILNGERLIPFWRGDNKQQGINLRRVFDEPRTFDLVLWFQGTAAAPYLEEGEVTDIEFWRKTQRVFGGRFFWFALWVN